MTERMVVLTLFCSGGRLADGSTRHEPIDIFIYDGPVPLPPNWYPALPHSELDLECERREGGCGRNWRPGEHRLGQVLTGLEAAGVDQLDISAL